MIDPLNPVEVGHAIDDTLRKCRVPLSDSQKIMLIGALAIWIEKARQIGEAGAVAAFKSALELDEAGYTSEYLSQRSK